MAIAGVTATVGKNEYTLNSSTEDIYEIDVSSPLTTSTIEVVATDKAGNTSIDTSQVLKIIGEWSPPKIDWSGEWDGGTYLGDYFTYVDYNRIKNNILFLIGYASQMYSVTQFDMGTEKEEGDIIYADEFNLFEEAISSLNSETYKFTHAKKTWYENKNVPAADDYNRIEKMELKIYETLVTQKKSQNRFAFKLGSQKGFKV